MSGWPGTVAHGRLERPGESPVATNGPVSNAAGYSGAARRIAGRHERPCFQRGRLFRRQCAAVGAPGLAGAARRGGHAGPAPAAEAQRRQRDLSRWRRIALCVHGCHGRSATVFKPYGVSLKITPRIDRNDVIRSLIEVEASSVDTSLNRWRTRAAHAPRVHRVQCPIRQHIGHRWLSVARAGPGREWFARVAGRACAGALFASRRYQLRETELAIFVTPRIVSAQGLAERAGTCSTRRFPTPRLGTSSLAADPDPAAGGTPTAAPGPNGDAAAVRAPHNQE